MESINFFLPLSLQFGYLRIFFWVWEIELWDYMLHILVSFVPLYFGALWLYFKVFILLHILYTNLWHFSHNSLFFRNLTALWLSFLLLFGKLSRTQILWKLWLKNFFKAARTDTRYFARSKFSRILVHKRNFGFIWHVVFKSEYLFCQGRIDTTFEFEWSRRKFTNNNFSR